MTLIHCWRTVVSTSPWGGGSGSASLPDYPPSRQSLRLHPSNSELNLITAKRRAGFLPLLEHARKGRGQVFMTCTEENWPRELAAGLQRWEVRAGSLRPSPL